MCILYYCYGHNGRKDANINELNKLQEYNLLCFLFHDISICNMVFYAWLIT